MTIFETIKEYDEDTMAEFLFRFAQDTISLLGGNFIIPTKEQLITFLKKEFPEEPQNEREGVEKDGEQGTTAGGGSGPAAEFDPGIPEGRAIGWDDPERDQYGRPATEV